MPRAGIVTVAGKPNVGKSTLLNRIVGQKLSITSPKPQSTRDRIVGIHTTDNAQMVILDTPGLLNPKYPLQQAMRSTAVRALDEADVIIYLACHPRSPKPRSFQHLRQLRSSLLSTNRTRSTPSGAKSSLPTTASCSFPL